MPSRSFKALVSLLLVGFGLSFTAPASSARTSSGRGSSSSTELSAGLGRNLLAGVMIATGLMFNVDSVLAAPASPSLDSVPTTLVAARSGGRAGGRAARAPVRAAAPPTTVQSTTIIRPVVTTPPVVVAPIGGFGYGYGYSNPLGGFGLGYGLGALNSAGDAIRDYRQDSEIQRDRFELELEKQKSAELESRIRQLEAAQAAAAK